MKPYKMTAEDMKVWMGAVWCETCRSYVWFEDGDKEDVASCDQLCTVEKDAIDILVPRHYVLIEEDE
jgi:hypothetical protein